MESKGRLTDVSRDFQTGKFRLTFTVDRNISEDVNDLQGDLRIKAVRWRENRSKDANALLWHCIGQIAAELDADKWDIYLRLLRRYGKYTYICIKPDAVDAMKAQWRECEVIGDIDIHGQKAVQLLCYFGSSTYDSKEFWKLLQGTISEMKEMGLPLPTTGDMKRALELWGKRA